MFEIMALDQAKLTAFYWKVFGWRTERSREGFNYIHFPVAERAALGGIGQASPGVPGWGRGTTFYLQTDDLPATLDKIEQHGGNTVVNPTKADGYTFAMFEDPECNLVGLMEPFPS